MKTIILIILSLIILSSSSFSDEKNFIETYNQNMYGDIRLIGNTVLEIDTSKNRTDNNYFLSDDGAAYGRKINSGIVKDLWTGSWTDVSSYEANNFTYMRYINVNNNADTSIFNSSSSTLTLPIGSKIVFARLYWSGMIHNFNNGSSLDTKKLNSKKVKFKIDNIDIGNGNNAFIDITVNKTNQYDTTEGWTEIEYINNNLAHSRYSAYKDITNILKNISFNGSQINVTTANVMSDEGWLRSYGNYGAWSLVVVYENYADIYRNVSLHTGYKIVYQTDTTIPISGFITPTTSTVSSTLSVFATEGEKTPLFGNDYLKVANKDDTNRISASNHSGYPNQSTNIFDSTITNDETKTPSISNTMGIDIDSFEIGVDGDTSHPQIIENLQTDTIIELSSGGDAYAVNTVALSTELYVPEFCYDYAYKQQNVYFTEDNNGSALPRLTGNVVNNEDINVTIYLKSLVRDIPIIDMYLDIKDINSTQVNYVNESTYLAEIGDLNPRHIPDSSLNIVSSNPQHVNNIYIGDIATDEYFYIYYSLDPQTTSLDMPLNIDVRYQLELNGQTIDYTSRLGVDMPMCPNTGLNYTPTTGIFNVVHNDYYNYDLNGSNRYYNLPTQVTSREGNFKVIALEPSDNDTLKQLSTIVGVELIDAGGFHYTDASCHELDSAISEQIWINIDDSTSAMFDATNLYDSIGLNNQITSGAEFYQNSRQNTAFRISYNVAPNTDDELVQTEKNNKGEYKILNFSEVVQVVGNCKRPVLYPLGNSNNVGTATRAAQACGNSGNFISAAHLQSCMECIYGLETRVVCSRDNFALRPEALMIKLNDQNQTNPAVIQRLDEDGLGIISGLPSSTQRVLNLASGYNYNLEVNATNHLNNSSPLGYTKSINTSEPNDFSGNIWEPRTPITNCQDTNNINHAISFVDGYANSEIRVNQVGEYRLNILDTTWTTVDNNPNYMTHHIAPYFLSSNIPDCVLNTSTTFPVGTSLGALTPVNGCNITSNHISSGSSIIYNDYNLTFHPYKFDMTRIVDTLGVNNDAIGANPFLYMADISDDNDENMSLHLNGVIEAQGFNNARLTNFTTGCYAKGVDLNISKDDTTLVDTNNNPVVLQSRFHNLNQAGAIVNAQDIDTNDTTPLTDMQISLTSTYFRTDMNGSIDTILNINYDRDKNRTVNPKMIRYSDYKVNCTNESANCQFKADLKSDKTTEGIFNIDANITHYYGRTNAPRQRFIAPVGTSSQPAQDFIYYEVYCDNPAICRTLLPNNGVGIVTNDDPRWYINPNHTSNYGEAERRTGITQKNASNVTGSKPSGNHLDSTSLVYNKDRGYPYKATMENNASSWLIYNKYNNNSNFNEFEVEFDGGLGSWAGQHETNVTTNSGGTNKTNRRSMW